MSASYFKTEAASLFDLPLESRKGFESDIILLPVPWDATTSYGRGAALGPQAMVTASHQLDLYDPELGKVYESGIHMPEPSEEILGWNRTAHEHVDQSLSPKSSQSSEQKETSLRKVNELSEKLNQWVYEQSKIVLDAKKILGVVGGDHSTPFGALKALSETQSSFGMLHFDAHFDLRNAYQGFRHSHASILFNLLQETKQIKKLVQVGIRDFSEEEWLYARSQKERLRTFFDLDLQRKRFEGTPWKTQAQEIIQDLPENVWVTFDIDGLDPRFCPNTGTPVPGGLSFEEACFVLRCLALSGRRILGFDLVEVAPSPLSQNSSNPSPFAQWDANVGMRLLYKLCGWTLYSQKKLTLPKS